MNAWPWCCSGYDFLITILFYILGKITRLKFREKLTSYVKIDDEIDQFLQEHLRQKTLKRGEILSTQHSVNRNLYYVESGLLRSFYYENGKDITSGFYTEESMLANKETLFLKQPTQNNIEAIEASVLVYFDYLQLEGLCENSLTIANLARKVLGVLLANIEKRVHSLQHMTAREKYGELINEQPEILMRAPLGMVATFLGISQETLSRIRSSV